MYSNYHHILVFCFKLKVAPLTSSLPPVVSFSYLQERMLVNSEHIMRPAFRLFSVSNQERILVEFETKIRSNMHNFVKLRYLNLPYHISSSWISNKHSWTMKIKNFSLLNFSKTTDLSFLASAQIPTFCRESTKINQERTKGKWMPTLHLAYIKSSAR